MTDKNHKIRVRLRGEDGEQTECTVSVVEAACLLVSGKAEPSVSLETDVPEVLDIGLSLTDAHEEFVENPFPWAPRHGVYARPAVRRHVTQLRAGDYREAMAWKTILRRGDLRRWVGMVQEGREREEVEIGDKGQGGTVTTVREMVGIALRVCLKEHQINLRMQSLLGWLSRGELKASGVFEEDLANLDRREIPAGWWVRDVWLVVGRNEVWEGEAIGSAKRRWSDVAVGSGSTNVVGTGAPGRPSSMHLVKEEFRRRVEAGTIERKLALEARALEAWLKQSHARHPPLTAKTIANRLRETYWSAKRALESKDSE